ncbi:MAG TPA: PA0069 family radical SAM protein [Opitutaceae bacterium]|nr:PA0069 family radical SAM protein [Opitutaceae bacterium]
MSQPEPLYREYARAQQRAIAGRGPGFNPPNRFERLRLSPDPEAEAEEAVDPRTEFYADASESLLASNDSPDVPWRFGINPYRGCEHGCAYCYARPYHEYLGWGSGLDFETKIMVKTRAPALLRRELAKPSWVPQIVAMSGVTDCYQPAERHFRLTRRCLEVFAEFRNPVGIITKNFLVTRDADLLAELARWHCAAVNLSITTLDSGLASRLEPRAARPEHRLRALRQLADAGVPVGVMVAPIIPGLNDHEVPEILAAAARAGATRAGYTILRLPWGVKDVFAAWLDQHEPGKKQRVLERVRELHGGRLSDGEFGRRFRGEGVFAQQIHDLFAVAARRAGFKREFAGLSAGHFRQPGGTQTELNLG